MTNCTVVSDIDGTLLVRRTGISRAVRDALVRLELLGASIILASGRPRASIMKLMDDAGLRVAVVSSNGNEVTSRVGERHVVKSFSRELVAACIDGGERYNAQAVFYSTDGRNFCTNSTAQLEYFLDSYDEPELLQADQSTLEAVSGEVVHCHLIKLDGWREAPRIAGASVLRSEPAYATATPMGVDKAVGVRILLEKADTLIVVGDGENDLPLFSLTGALRVAMSGGHHALRRAADVLAPTVELDGFAWLASDIIEPLLRDREGSHE